MGKIWLFLFILSFIMSKITVAIMVKNEETNIIKTLTSCVKYMDNLVIYDTGSEDRTVEVIEHFCKNNHVKLHLLTGQFEGYSISRNKLLDFTENIVSIGSFYMILDANDELRASYDFVDNLQKNIPLDIKLVMVNSKWKVQYSVTSHVKVLFIRSGVKVRYDGSIHEYLKIGGEPITSKFFIEGIELFQDRTEDEKRTLRRSAYDISMLEEDIKAGKHVGRNMYLLARTYFNMKQYDKALEAIGNAIKFHEEGGYMDTDEKYMLQYYSAIIKKNLGKSWIENVFNGYELMPDKIECLLFLCLDLSVTSKWNTLYMFANKAIEIARRKSFMNDVANNETDYTIYCWYYHVLACLHIGRIEEGLESIKVIDKNIGRYDFKDEAFNDVRVKYDYLRGIYLPMGLGEGEYVVLFGGYGYSKWNGSNINGKGGLGGAETVVSSLAREMRGRRERVVVFCDTEEDCLIDGVYYLTLDKYDVFLRMKGRKISNLVVFRYAPFLRYGDNIDNVVLVLEDIMPIGNSVKVEDKLRAIVCKTEWHKEYLVRTGVFGEISDRLVVIGNGIDIGRFSGRGSKRPWRFIYSSCMTRGLNNLLNMWKDIREIVEEAELHLFITYECPYYQPHHGIEDMIKQIEELKDYGVVRHERVSQKELANHIMQSDIWLYPTEFSETFCITALEMQAGGVLCICTELAGLIETVGDRGIMVEGGRNKEVWLDIIRQVKDGRIDKSGLIGRGYEWANSRGWDVIAEEYGRVLV